MKRETAIWFVVALILLIVGTSIGRWATNKDSDLFFSEPGGGTAFRQWFWERRTLDLMTQVGLIFAGALGVAALLPGQSESDASTSQVERGG